MNAAAGLADGRALRELVGQTVLSGTGRRAALLKPDALPQALAKPHYQRLARNAMMGLADRQQAQCFDLPRGGLAIVWRSRGPHEAEGTMAALTHLLSGLPADQAVPLGTILSLFDLPAQAPWLLDALGEAQHPDVATDDLDDALLDRLEAALAQASLAPFMRWRPVIDLGGASPALAWEERSVSLADLASALCPGKALQGEGWRHRRLARSLERRVLALLAAPRELAGQRPFSLRLTVATILSPGFLDFDAALPAGLRGQVVLVLDAADILADGASFCFARDFARARGYRLCLRGGAVPDAALLDASRAGVDYLDLTVAPALLGAPETLPPRDGLVLDGIDDVARLAWARRQGCTLIKGRAVG